MVSGPKWRLNDMIWYHVYYNTTMRAKRKGIVCDLDLEWAKSTWTGKCSVTGLEFRKGTSRGPAPYSPSIDRIKPELGYLQGNCRWVLFAVNALKSTGTDEDMMKIVDAIRSSNG
jgi:hypothetical protein